MSILTLYNKWYAVHLDMTGLHCIIVGGGRIAVRRMHGLVEAGATVTIISPQCHPDIHRAAAEGNVHMIMRNYEGEADLADVDMVFAATNDGMVNRLIAKDAKKLRIMVNHVGDSSLSSFTVPAVLKRGQLVMSVSTSGASPGLAKQIRDELSDRYGDEYALYVDFLADLRERVNVKVVHEQIRARIFQKVLGFDIIELIRTDRLNAFHSWFSNLLEQELLIDEWEQQLAMYGDHI